MAATKTVYSTDLPEIAQQVREQLVSSVKQGQKVTLEAVQAFAKAAAKLPTPEMPEIPGVAALPSVTDVATYNFDLAVDLLTAQRDFALQLASAFTPAKV
jgi:hypothetical protein